MFFSCGVSLARSMGKTPNTAGSRTYFVNDFVVRVLAESRPTFGFSVYHKIWPVEIECLSVFRSRFPWTSVRNMKATGNNSLWQRPDTRNVNTRISCQFATSTQLIKPNYPARYASPTKHHWQFLTQFLTPLIPIQLTSTISKKANHECWLIQYRSIEGSVREKM